jgi:hypothetical protein
MGIMDIIGGGSKENKAFDRQMRVEEDKAAMDYSARNNDWASAGQESQVNLYIVSNSRKFLKYKLVKIKKPDGFDEVISVRDEKFAFIEPYNDDDPLSFSDADLRIVVNEFGRALTDIYEYVYKYDSPENEDEINALVSDFNFVVRLRNDVLANTRTTGQSVKAAKSQSVTSVAEVIRRSEDAKPKPFGSMGR